MSPEKADRSKRPVMDLNRFVSEKVTMLILLASETCALETIGAEYVRDVLPGEVVTITPEGRHSVGYVYVLCQRNRRHAVFLNIFILQDRTAISTVSASMHPGSRQDVSLPWIHRWMQIL